MKLPIYHAVGNTKTAEISSNEELLKLRFEVYNLKEVLSKLVYAIREDVSPTIIFDKKGEHSTILPKAYKDAIKAIEK